MTACAIAALVASASSCNSSGCLENRNSVPLAGFYEGTGASVALDSLQITGVGMPVDDPLLAAGDRVSSIYLPMRSVQQSTAWVFSYKWKDLDFSELNDTLAFDYDTTPYFASTDCGVINRYRITRMSYTTHLIDSVVLADSLITNVDIEQIKIYFRTADADQPDEPEETESEQ